MEFIVEICGKMDYYIEIMGQSRFAPMALWMRAGKGMPACVCGQLQTGRQIWWIFGRIRTRRRRLWNFMWR